MEMERKENEEAEKVEQKVEEVKGWIEKNEEGESEEN